MAYDVSYQEVLKHFSCSKVLIKNRFVLLENLIIIKFCNLSAICKVKYKFKITLINLMIKLTRLRNI